MNHYLLPPLLEQVSRINQPSDVKNVLQFVVAKYWASPAYNSLTSQIFQEELTKVWDQTQIDVYNPKDSVDSIDQKESKNLHD
jgi:hypothetical protein